MPNSGPSSIAETDVGGRKERSAGGARAADLVAGMPCDGLTAVIEPQSTVVVSKA